VASRRRASEAAQLRLTTQHPGDYTWLSLRSSHRVVPKTLLRIDVHYWVWLPERLRTQLLSRVPVVRNKFRHEPIIGLEVREAISKRQIVAVPAIAKYEGSEVELVGGERLRPDLVVFATGFSYRTDHLDGLVDLAPDGLPRVHT